MTKKIRNIKALIIFGIFLLIPVQNIIFSTLDINNIYKPKSSAIYNSVNINDLPGSSTNWVWAESQSWFGGGSGSLSNPYIIEGHTFDGNGTGSSLSIENSNKYFIVQECELINSGSSLTNGGLFLSNVTNAIITNNNFSNNYNGVYFENSNNIEIISNIVTDNSYVGIWGQYSNNYTNINDNYVKNNQWGIAIDDGNNDIVRNNTILDSYLHDGILLYGAGNDCIVDYNYIKTSIVDGIRIESFSNSIIYHNTIINSTNYGINLNNADNTLVYDNYLMDNTIHAIDNGVNNNWNNSLIGNYWDDYPGYDMNLDGIGDDPYSISGVAGAFDYLPIWNIQAPIVINDLPSSLNNWAWAVTQAWCSGSGTELDPYIIESMNIDANLTDNCISILNSEAYFTIQGCNLYNSSSGGSDGGIFLQNVTNGKIIDNYFYNHRNAAIFCISSDYITVSENILKNHRHGIYLGGQYNEIIANSIYGDGSGSGIVFQGNYHDNLVNGNTIENCWQGMFIFDAENNTFTSNTALKNLQHGIAVTTNANNNNFSNNFLLNNTLSGIVIENSRDNTVEESRIISNQQHGIFLMNADYTTVYYNRIINNIFDGVHLETGSTNNLFYRNFFGGNGNHAYDNGALNDWNSTTIGNYWDNHTGPDTSPADGIVDTPYLYIGGGAGSIDYLPIAEDGPPEIIINSPSEGQTFGSNAPSFSVTITDAFILDMWYTIDGGVTKYFFTTNGTIDQTAWDALPEGSVTITFYANDTGGNLTSESVNIVKNLPEDNPLLLIIIIVSSVAGAAVIVTFLLIRMRKKREQE